MRTYCSGLLVAACLAAPAAAQTPTTTSTSSTAVTQDEIVLQGDTTPRPSLPTINGDTGIWFVPTAETLPAGRWSFSVFRSNFDRRQGLTDVSQLGLTAAVALGDRVEVFGSWKTVRLDRDVRPVFIPAEPEFGGVSQEYPYMRRYFSETLGGPVQAGFKVSLLSQSRGDAMSLAPRLMVKFPSGATWASTNDWDGHLDLVASREFGRTVELSGIAGAVLRGDSDEFRVSDGVTWGLGAQFPSRSALRALVEWQGEFVINKFTEVLGPPYVAEDGSVAPMMSPISDPTNFKVGAAWNASNGMFVHGGLNYSFGTGSRIVNGVDIDHNSWGFDVRLGWHPGVTPARERVRVIKETTTVTNTVTPPPPPAPNRNPTFSVNATCDPSTVAPGATSRCTATATDPDGDAVTYRWTAPSGSFNPVDAAGTTWTAGQNTGSVPITVTATDSRGGTATSTVSVNVARRVEIVLEDVHFDFDKFNIREDARAILQKNAAALMANGDVRVTIEGHTDSIGTSEYNQALGERRANSVREFLVNLGIGNTRMTTVSYGEGMPADTNNTAAGRQRNRRAHFVVIMEGQ